MNYDEVLQSLDIVADDPTLGVNHDDICANGALAIRWLQARVAELTDELQIECAARQTALAERDALRALLKVAQDCIYSLDAREIYADELARIDAALAEDKP